MPISIVVGLAEPVASRKRSVGAARPRGVDDQGRGETSLGSARVLEAHPRDASIVGRGDHLRHARARPEFDIRLPFDPATAYALQGGARQAEKIEAEVALRKRIETRNLLSRVAAHAYPNGAGLDEIELDARKQTLERAMSAREQPVRMARLRRAGARRGRVGQNVAVEHDDLFEMGRYGFRSGEASHPGANDDGLLQNRIGHSYVSRQTRRRQDDLRSTTNVCDRRHSERAPLQEDFINRISRYVRNVTSMASRSIAGSGTKRPQVRRLQTVAARDRRSPRARARQDRNRRSISLQEGSDYGGLR